MATFVVANHTVVAFERAIQWFDRYTKTEFALYLSRRTANAP